MRRLVVGLAVVVLAWLGARGRVAGSTDGRFLSAFDPYGASAPLSEQKVRDLLRLSVHALAERRAGPFEIVPGDQSLRVEARIGTDLVAVARFPRSLHDEPDFQPRDRREVREIATFTTDLNDAFAAARQRVSEEHLAGFGLLLLLGAGMSFVVTSPALGAILRRRRTIAPLASLVPLSANHETFARIVWVARVAHQVARSVANATETARPKRLLAALAAAGPKRVFDGSRIRRLRDRLLSALNELEAIDCGFADRLRKSLCPHRRPEPGSRLAAAMPSQGAPRIAGTGLG